MPSKSGNSRAMEMGALHEVIHDRKKNSTVRDLLEEADPKTPFQKRAYTLIKRDFDRAVAIPSKLASDLAATTSLAQMAWQKARQNNDFSAFSPHFTSQFVGIVVIPIIPHLLLAETQKLLFTL